MQRSRTRYIALLAAAAITLYLCWLMIEPFVEVVLGSAVLAIVAYPLHVALLRRTQKPSLSALLTVLILIVIVLLPLVLVTVAIFRQAPDALESLQRGAMTLLAPDSRIGRLVEPYLDVQTLRDPQFWAQRLSTIAGIVTSRTLNVVGGVLGAVVKIFFTIFALFYLLRDGPRIMMALHDSLPLEQHQADAIFQRTQQVISASVYGVLVIAAIQGFLGGLIFAILGIKSPVLWGVVMFLLSMIPMGGAALVWAPAALFLVATNHYYKAAVLVAFGVGVIGLIDNLLRPRLVGGKTRLHELVVFFAVLGGLQVFGVLGLVVGPVVVALTLAVLDVLRHAEPPPPEPIPVTPVAPAPPPSEPPPSPMPGLVKEPPPKPRRNKKWKQR